MKFLKDTIRGGLFFLFPLSILIYFGSRFWTIVDGFGKKVSLALDLKEALGFNGTLIVTILLIINLCFISGLLLRVSLFEKFKKWVDSIVLEYLPGYEFYKASLQNNLGVLDKDSVQIKREVVLLNLGGLGQMAVLIEALKDDRVILFIPSKPNSTEGKVQVVSNSSITRLGINEVEMNEIIGQQGEGLSKLLIIP